MDNVLSVNINKNSNIYFARAADILPKVLPKGRVVVISDENIARLYPTLLSDFETIIIGQGESNKTLQSVERIYEQLIELGADRSTFLLGVGGGIVSDITGFVAATYMRGIRFGFVSTTVLSQVDAGVGGKNGVNLGGFKNMVGTFNQPEFVICDTSMLATLSEREFRAGLAELIKAAIITDADLFAKMELLTFEQLRSDEQILAELIHRAVEIKAEVVRHDEREHGQRRKLNLGHTFAHAIEKLHSQSVNHGEAVAMGMVIIARMAHDQGLLSHEAAQRIIAMLNRYGFEIEPPTSVDELRQYVAKDKKVEGSDIYLVLPTDIGECIVRRTPLSDLM